MNLRLIIDNQMSTFSKNDKIIAEYILNNMEIVIHESVHALAKATNTSAATIIRFTKKLGFNGFPPLKIALAKEIEAESIANSASTSNSKTVFEEIKLLSTQSINRTIEGISPDKLELFVEKILNANRIFIHGSKEFQSICQDFKVRLLAHGFNVFFEPDENILVNHRLLIDENDLIIVVSGERERASIYENLSKLSRKGISLISIVSSSDNVLTLISEASLISHSLATSKAVTSSHLKSGVVFIMDMILLMIENNE